jgi:8-oxo-dGTP diphosphatase
MSSPVQLQVGVKVLIRNDQNQYLFMKRSQELLDGSGIRWDVPGGRIDPEETLHQGLEREVMEETGLTLTGELELLDAQDIILPERGIHAVRLTYRAKASGDVRLGDEHQEHQWLALPEIDTVNIDDYLAQTLQKLS